MKKLPFYTGFYYFGRFLARVVYPHRRIVHRENLREGVVYIGRHMDMFGPIQVMANIPVGAHLWVYHVFTQRADCYAHFKNVTFALRKNWPAWRRTLMAALCAPLVVRLMRAMDAIPVYRSHRDVLHTFELSMEKLLKGESLMIFPDIAYDDTSGEPGAFYTGYLHLGRTFQKKTGKPLLFVPLYAGRSNGTLEIGESLQLETGASFPEEKERVTQSLQRFFREAAQRAGDL